MLPSEIHPGKSYHNDRGISYSVESIEKGRVYYHIKRLDHRPLFSMEIEEFAKAMVAEVKEAT